MRKLYVLILICRSCRLIYEIWSRNLRRNELNQKIGGNSRFFVARDRWIQWMSEILLAPIRLFQPAHSRDMDGVGATETGRPWPKTPCRVLQHTLPIAIGSSNGGYWWMLRHGLQGSFWHVDLARGAPAFAFSTCTQLVC